MSKFIELNPHPYSLMGSMRSMGYDFEVAVADVIDNSISAQANEIHVFFPKTPTDALAVGILDNGTGMNENVLLEAMRYGSQSCEEKRKLSDLGRFGLGLKSASLSQCKVLTVATIDINGDFHAASWDYGKMKGQESWMLEMLSLKELKTLPYIGQLLKQEQGTLVVWQDFDVLAKTTKGNTYDKLRELKPRVAKHIALIFHRLLGHDIQRNLSIHVDNYNVEPRDPFLEHHKKCNIKKEDTVAITDSFGEEHLVKIQPFILPYKNELTFEDHELLGGIENLIKNQGFYIYRNKRLIEWGKWYGMAPRASGNTQYARIRVDIPNALDDIWELDITKQSARIPTQIKRQLRKTVEEALETSTKQQTYRGTVNDKPGEIERIWNRIEGREKRISFVVNRENKLYKYIALQLGDNVGYLETLITEIEKNIPTQQISVDKNLNLDFEDEFVDTTSERLNKLMSDAISMIEFGRKASELPLDKLIDNILKMEQYVKHPTIKEELLKYYQDGSNKAQ